MQTGVKVVLVDFYLLKVKKKKSNASVTVLSLTAAAVPGRQTSHTRAEICGGEVLCPNREDPTSHIKEDPQRGLCSDRSYFLLSASWTRT